MAGPKSSKQQQAQQQQQQQQEQTIKRPRVYMSTSLPSLPTYFSGVRCRPPSQATEKSTTSPASAFTPVHFLNTRQAGLPPLSASSITKALVSSVAGCSTECKKPEKFCCLKWTDFEKHLSAHFVQLHNSQDTADLTIVCGADHVMLRAHQLVLSLGSVYFREALEVRDEDVYISLIAITTTFLQKVFLL